MKGAALSAQIKTASPARVARNLAQARITGSAPTAGAVFVSGALARRAVELGALLAEALPGTALIIASGAGVLTEQGEQEREDAASAILWRQGKATPLVGSGRTVDEGCESLAEQLRHLKGPQACATALVFARPDGVTPAALQPLAATPLGARMFGGGTIGGCDPVVVHPKGSVIRAPIAALLLHTSPPLLRSSPACRLLCDPMRISRVRGSMVLELDGEPALDVLSRVGRGLPDSPLVFAVLGVPATGIPRGQVVRAVQGVDPIRSGIMVSEEAVVGRELSFGVRDPAVARADLERHLHEMEQELAGAAPVFGIYVNCAGRGSGLYGVGDVDTRLIRHRFGNMPVAGMQSSFEIVPMGDAPALQLYSGVMALFTAPS